MEAYRSAHLKAMEVAKEAWPLLSYDPNLRLPLWPSPEEARKKIMSIRDKAEVIKVSDNELEFLTGSDKIDDEIAMSPWHPNMKLLLVTLGDRGCNYYTKITLKRTWSRMPLWHKTKLMYSLIFQSIFLPSPLRLKEMLNELNDVDMLTLVIQEMSKEFPTMLETLVHERDQYMSSSLLKVAQENSSVVAVVGKGHLQGIQKYWKQPVEVRELLELPSAKPAISVMKVVSTAGVLVAGVAIVTGIYLSSKK